MAGLAATVHWSVQPKLVESLQRQLAAVEIRLTTERDRPHAVGRVPGSAVVKQSLANLHKFIKGVDVSGQFGR
jgi:hypothetical protein